MTEFFNRVKQFTSKQQGLDEKDITEDACLEKDLGIYGDDATEYLIAFGKEFNVDVSQFMAADYFSPEGLDFIDSFIKFFTGKKKNKQPKKELTIWHLEKAVIAGRLDEDVING